MIDDQTALMLARAEADRRSLSTNWKPAYIAAQPRPPLYVEILDHSEPDYYIIDFRTGTRPTGRMIFDVNTGHLGEIIGIDANQVSLPQFLSPAEAAVVVVGWTVEVTRDSNAKPIAPRTVTIKAEDVTLLAHLGWRVCDQSHSPLQPFYRIVLQSTFLIYLRIDGRPYPELTVASAGA